MRPPRVPNGGPTSATLPQSDAPTPRVGMARWRCTSTRTRNFYAKAGLFVHPLLATVTYLCDAGAPTLVVPGCTISTEGQYNFGTEPTISAGGRSSGGSAAALYDSACLVPPRVGRHLRFDGCWLHGAPDALVPTGGEYRRVTFLVNIWIGHKPGRCVRFAAPWASAPGRGLGGCADGGSGAKRAKKTEGGNAETPFRFRQRRVVGTANARKTALRASGATGGGCAQGRVVGGISERFELALEQTATPHVLRIGATVTKLQQALRGDAVVVVRGRDGGAAAASLEVSG